MSICSDVRVMLYAGFLFEWCAIPVCYCTLKPFPFGPAIQPLGRFCITTPQCIFTCITHSHLLGALPSSALRLSPSLPCTPTFDNQSLAVGRCCLSTTLRVGVTPTWTFSCQGSNLHLTFAAHPLYLRIVSSERVAHTGCRRRGWARLV